MQLWNLDLKIDFDVSLDDRIPEVFFDGIQLTRIIKNDSFTMCESVWLQKQHPVNF